MFCKNCGIQLSDGQTFCSNCGAKVEQVNNNAQGNLNTNPTVNDNAQGNTVNNISSNSNNNGKNNNSKIIIIIVIVIAVIFMAFILMVIPLFTKFVEEGVQKNNNDGVSETVKNNSNKKLYKGYHFTTTNDCVVSVLQTGELSITKGDITYLIIIDDSTYETNLQSFISNNPVAASTAEVTIKNRKAAGGFLTDGSVVLFTKASDTQIFGITITSTGGNVGYPDIEYIIDILNNTKKDESTLSNDIDTSTDEVTNKSNITVESGIGTKK